MEGSKESAGEEDGWQGGGGRGLCSRTVVWILLFECAFLGAEGVCEFVHIRNERVLFRHGGARGMVGEGVEGR